MLKKLANLVNDLNKDGFEKEAGAIDELVGMLSKALKDVDESDEEEESEEQGEQVEFHGESTENFDLCPGAVKAFNSLEDKVDDDSKDIALEALRQTDELLGIERGVIESEEATPEVLKNVSELALSVTYKAGVLSQKIDTDLSDDFAFLNMHIEKVASYIKN